MNVVYKGILTLVRSVITGEKLHLPEGFRLEDADELISKHSLLPIAFQGAYQCGIPMDSEIMKRYNERYFLKLIHNQQQIAAAQKIFSEFEKAGIDYMPLKGCNLKSLYPQPELRVMGDADILIRPEQYDRIVPIMKSLEYNFVEESTHDFCWRGNKLYVELHKRLFEPEYVDLCSCFGDSWNLAVKGDGYRYHMTPEYEYIYIFCHMLKHFRFFGIGARQIIDLYVFRRAHPQMDENLIADFMKQLNVQTFYENILRLLEVWFADRESDDVTDFITDYIFRNGNFGTMENRVNSEVLAGSNGQVTNARGKAYIRALFPPVNLMKQSYHVLYKLPVLIPLFYLIRWFDILINRSGSILRKIRVINSVSDEKVIAHKNRLKYMGLEYYHNDK